MVRTQMVICDECNFCWEHETDERIERQRISELYEMLKRIHSTNEEEDVDTPTFLFQFLYLLS